MICQKKKNILKKFWKFSKKKIIFFIVEIFRNNKLFSYFLISTNHFVWNFFFRSDFLSLNLEKLNLLKFNNHLCCYDFSRKKKAFGNSHFYLFHLLFPTLFMHESMNFSQRVLSQKWWIKFDSAFFLALIEVSIKKQIFKLSNEKNSFP